MMLLQKFVIFVSIVTFKVQLFHCANLKDTCDVNKKCIFKPPGCTPTIDCVYFMSYSVQGDNIVIELSAMSSQPRNSYQWVAAGFSDDNQMGDDAVVYCLFTNDNKPHTAGVAYTTRTPKGVTLVETRDSNTVSLGIANVVNSTYMCRVQRILAQKLPNPDPRIKPLNTSYYVFLASGPATSSTLFNGHVMNRADPKFPHISERMDITGRTEPGTVTHGTPGPIGGTSKRPSVEIGGENGETGGTDDQFKYEYALNIKKECNKTKGCLSKPKDCTPFVDCNYFMSYSPSGDWVNFELLTTSIESGTSDQWVAVGFSNDRRMGDDPVTFCIYSENDEDAPLVSMGYNTGNNPTVILNDTNPMNPTVKMINVLSFHGSWLCQFQQKVTPSEKNSMIQPLNNPYYILLSSGLSNENPTTLLQHTFDEKNEKYPLVSESKLQMTNIWYHMDAGASRGGSVLFLSLSVVCFFFRL